jgi:hypothetical protein
MKKKTLKVLLANGLHKIITNEEHDLEILDDFDRDFTFNFEDFDKVVIAAAKLRIHKDINGKEAVLNLIKDLIKLV